MKKAFTLIEMLIVIVIIGILAAALIPRLVSVQGRARDTKRKVDLQQIGNALTVYKSDNNLFPLYSGSTYALFSQGLVTNFSNYMSNVPSDPTNSPVSGEFIPSTGYYTGQGYGYIALTRAGKTANGMALMAGTETDGASSNMVSTGLTYGTDAAYVDGLIAGCAVKVTKGTSRSWTGGNCITPASGLRYYFTQ